jgi:general stress protein CsbA
MVAIGNIFSPTFLLKMKIFQINCPFYLLLIFLFTQIIGKKYVAMATMIICVKHFVNIPDKKKILTLKIIIKKMGN